MYKFIYACIDLYIVIYVHISKYTYYIYIYLYTYIHTSDVYRSAEWVVVIYYNKMRSFSSARKAAGASDSLCFVSNSLGGIAAQGFSCGQGWDHQVTMGFNAS